MQSANSPENSLTSSEKEAISTKTSVLEKISTRPVVPSMTAEEKRECYQKLFRPCTKLTGDLMEKAKAELNETDERRKEALEELRAKLNEKESTEDGKKVLEMFQNKDDSYLLRFLRTKKFDVERTYNQMAGYAKFHLKHEEITSLLSFKGIKHALEQGFPIVLPVRDKQGRVILLFDTGSWDRNVISFDELIASFLYILELLIENEANQINGFVLVETYETFHITQALAMKVTEVKKMADLIQGSFPGRFKGFHVIHQPLYFSIVWTLSKPFMSSKFLSRIFIHGSDLKKYLEEFDPKYLPVNFGGADELFDPKPMLAEIKAILEQRGEITQDDQEENIAGAGPKLKTTATDEPADQETQETFSTHL